MTAETVDAAARALRGRAIVGSAPEGLPAPAVTVLLSLPREVVFDDAAALRFARAIVEQSPDADRLVVSIGQAAEGVEAAIVSLHEAVDLTRGGRRRAGSGPQLRRAEDRPLVQLMTAFRGDHRMLAHGERMLAPLIEHDLGRNGDLIDVLESMLAHPGNRTAAASASHLSRSVFYQRLSLIQELLDVDLDDGETQTSLHIALLVRRIGGPLTATGRRRPCGGSRARSTPSACPLRAGRSSRDAPRWAGARARRTRSSRRPRAR